MRQSKQRSVNASVRYVSPRDCRRKSLALTCDLDRTYIGGIERGERNVSLINIEKLAVALGVPVRELF